MTRPALLLPPVEPMCEHELFAVPLAPVTSSDLDAMFGPLEPADLEIVRAGVTPDVWADWDARR